MSRWRKTDRRKKRRIQMPDYTDQDVLKTVEGKLAKYPPLVFAGEARNAEIGACRRPMRNAFLLQRR